jgi:hypothetical protein
MDSRSLDERRCGVCGAVLSHYNPGEFCYPCQESGKPYLSAKTKPTKTKLADIVEPYLSAKTKPTKTELADIVEPYLSASTKLSDLVELGQELSLEKYTLLRR